MFTWKTSIHDYAFPKMKSEMALVLVLVLLWLSLWWWLLAVGCRLSAWLSVVVCSLLVVGVGVCVGVGGDGVGFVVLL